MGQWPQFGPLVGLVNTGPTQTKDTSLLMGFGHGMVAVPLPLFGFAFDDATESECIQHWHCD